MCSYRNQGFDIRRVEESAKQLEGIHDFRTFMKVSKEDRTVISSFILINPYYFLDYSKILY